MSRIIRQLEPEPMKPAQRRALALLREHRVRHLYEAGDATGKNGSGRWYVTHTGDCGSPELSTEQVEQLARDGHIVIDFPGFYKLNPALE